MSNTRVSLESLILSEDSLENTSEKSTELPGDEDDCGKLEDSLENTSKKSTEMPDDKDESAKPENSLENTLKESTERSNDEDDCAKPEDSVENTSEESTKISDDDDECAKPGDDDNMEYLDSEVFPMLLPCFEKMLFVAKQKDVLKLKRSRFSGLDYLAELLWNKNPHHPERHNAYIPMIQIPFAETWIQSNPRPFFPKSLVWSPVEAAVVIQSAVRGYLVRQMPDVQELRQFWKILSDERRKE